MDAPNKPYSTLGKHLKYLREQQAESLAEVSGAVEIDESVLANIESGQERPAEDILMLLISHFDMQDQEAVQLWELAGYSGSDGERRHQEELVQEVMNGHRSVVVLVGMDSRVMYTDSAQAEATGSGVTLRFGQLNSKQQSQTIAQLGMSRDQALKVISELQLAVLKADHQSGPKRLPPARS